MSELEETGHGLLSSFGLQSVTVECPICGRCHILTVQRDEIRKLCHRAGHEAVRTRLAALRLDRALVRCAACVIQHGGEQPPHTREGETR